MDPTLFFYKCGPVMLSQTKDGDWVLVSITRAPDADLRQQLIETLGGAALSAAARRIVDGQWKPSHIEIVGCEPLTVNYIEDTRVSPASPVKLSQTAQQAIATSRVAKQFTVK